MKKVQKYKMCRRLGSGVFEKCQTPKYLAAEAKHVKKFKNKRPKMLSGYALQFLEKQKVRFMYNISEKQFSNYIKEAISNKEKSASEYLFELLETRLDNVVYRMGLAQTRRAARQMTSHGHITINGKKTTVPSQRIKIGDIVAVRSGSSQSVLFSDLKQRMEDYILPNWLNFKLETLSGSIQGKPKNNENYLDFNTVLEFYSR
jgi:small subunit ribosomal protein S4